MVWNGQSHANLNDVNDCDVMIIFCVFFFMLDYVSVYNFAVFLVNAILSKSS